MRRAMLAVLVLPLFVAGCGPTSSTTATANPSVSSTAPWMAVATGSATPSPSPSLSYASPSPFPTGFLPSASAGTATATVGASLTCDAISFKEGVINGAGVQVGTTSAVVSWYNPGGSDLTQYRVTAISQDLKTGAQRDVGWTVVTPGTPCSTMSATVTGLDRKTRYTFSVDAVFSDSELGMDGTSADTVARSGVFTTG